MRLPIIFLQKVHIVCCNQGQAHFLGKVYQSLADLRCVIVFVVLDFDEESIGADYFHIAFGGGSGCSFIAIGQ